MIQRIQSLLLAGVVILLTINLFVPIWSSSNGITEVKLTAFSIDLDIKGKAAGLFTKKTAVYYVGGLISLNIALALLIIFQFKNRARQILLCNLLTLLTLGIIGSYFIAIPKAKTMMVAGSGDYGIGYFLPIIACMLIMAARYYIKKDEELVRSVDRLR